MHEKQSIALDLLNKNGVSFVGYGGSARSGKSWIASEWLTMQCLSYKGVGYGLARKELKNLKRTTLLTLFKVFEKYGLENKVDYNYNQQDSIITFKNKSQIFLIDTAYQPSDPLHTRFGGYELTGCVIDESNETMYEIVEILSGRCGFRLNDYYNISATILETFNPDKGHVYNRYYKPHRDRKESDTVKFIPALPSDNPDPQVKEWLDIQKKTSSETTIQRLIHGNFDYDESKDRLINQDSVNNLFTNSHVLDTGRKFITADIARLGDDSTVIYVWDGWKVIERYEINKSLVTESAKYIKDLSIKHEIPMSRVIVDEDGVGGGVVDILRCVGFIANKRPTSKRLNYSNRKTECAFNTARILNNNKAYMPNVSQKLMDKVKQELDWLRQKDIDKEGKIRLVPKSDIKESIGRSPDDLDNWIMRSYFELGQKL